MLDRKEYRSVVLVGILLAIGSVSAPQALAADPDIVVNSPKPGATMTGVDGGITINARFNNGFPPGPAHT